jgi:hypothetical protein
MGGKHFVENAIYIRKTGHRQRMRFSNHSATAPTTSGSTRGFTSFV